MTELAFPSGLRPGLGGTTLGAIRDVLRPRTVLRFCDERVEGLAAHSDEVRPGTLFFAVPGTKRNGGEFVDQALRKGAIAVVADRPMNIRVPVLVVDDVRRAVADAACAFFDNPSASIGVIGVTGTNGKTTVTNLVRHCLESDGRACASFGTIAYEFGGRRLPATTTTPDAIQLQGYLREVADRRIPSCVMEVSSHGLEQQRVRGVHFKVGAFLNLSHDHLDYHGDMRSYARAKARLFEALRPGATAVINIDDPAHETMLAALRPGVRVVTFGRAREATFRADEIRGGLDGTRFHLTMPRGDVVISSGLIGEHNVMNALAAAAIGHSLGLTELTIAQALETACPVRGRMELVGERNGVRVFVDYAHTPDALEKVSRTLRGMTEGRLTVVFGCGGDRDRAKRPRMARAASRYADRIFLTSDNPRGEDPERILDDVEAGFAGVERGIDCVRVADRAAAIERSVRGAAPGDVVLIAGKGHETYQILGDSVIPFDDREWALRALRSGQ